MYTRSTFKTDFFLPMEPIMIFCLLFFIIFCLRKLVFQKREACCYMMAYECYKAPADRKLDTDTCARIVLRSKNLGLQEYKFLLETIVSSGIGEETCGTRNVISGHEDSPTLKDSISEMDDLIFDTLDKLFATTGNISPSEIDILVVNVSLFSPAPSLTARVVNRYKMRSNVKTFNLSGMGCSASIVAIDLVQHLFKRLLNALHKQQCFKTSSYLQIETCRALFTANLRVLLPKLLPLSEQLRYVYVSRQQNKTKRNSLQEMGAGLNLKTGVDHFCVHPGGRAIIDEAGKSLSLSNCDLEPARMALLRFGNKSAGGLWYVLAYVEAKQRLKRCNKILMISLGAGFKCNNCVFEVMRDLKDAKDSRDQYPPETTVNPFIEKYSWVNDEYLSFVRFQ
ncbi:hypothetical protein POTOM_031053 [Populus tomentosa]|uniref:3-ketoacyl-CoA synthase n=1 Tax=Populus tomentosa TaxID=118781 RepID=A0A8X8CRD2_POPTO|nr:hypothetical protein POTOM_031053 [Populus tomentosa]